MNREIKAYGDQFIDFYSKLDKDIQDKFEYVFELVRSLNMIPKRFFQHLESTDGLFEIRVGYEGSIYRVFCFFDEGNVIVLVSAFQKKSQKTPLKELDLAKKLKNQYFLEKKINTRK